MRNSNGNDALEAHYASSIWRRLYWRSGRKFSMTMIGGDGLKEGKLHGQDRYDLNNGRTRSEAHTVTILTW